MSAQPLPAAQTTDIPAALDFLERRFGDIHMGYAVLGFIKASTTSHEYINLQAPDRWERAAWIVEKYAATHDCYLAAAVLSEPGRTNPTTGKVEYRTTEMIAFVPTLYTDRDTHPYPATLPVPSYTVETSTGSFQDYFVLGKPTDAETAGHYLRRIAAACGLGNQAVDAARLLRLPGTINRKPERSGEVVRIVEQSGTVYSLEDFDRLPHVAPSMGSPNGTIKSADRKIPEGGRHTELVRASGSMRHYGISQEAIYVALTEMNQEQCNPPLEDDEVRRIAMSAKWDAAPPEPVRKNGHREEPIPLRPEADGPRQFTTYGPDDLKAMPPLQFRVENWIPESGLVGIIGKSGDMKTFVALDLAFSVATERTWNGCDVRGGPVLYVAAEGRSGMGQRITAWEMARNEMLDNERFRLITDAPQLLTAEHVDAVIATAKLWHAEAIFLDTLARTMDGDENSTKDMSAYVTACNHIQRATGATVVIVHHMGWNGDRQRGSSAFFAAMDAEITVTKDGESVTAKVTKAKDFPNNAEMTFAPRVVQLANRGSSVVLDRSDASTPELTGVARRIGNILWETFGEGGATQSEWKAVCEDLKIAERSFYFGRTGLVAGGYITDPAGRTRGHRYTITDAFVPFLIKKSDEGAIGAVTLSEGAVAPLEVPEDRCKGAAAPLGAAPLHLSTSDATEDEVSGDSAAIGAVEDELLWQWWADVNGGKATTIPEDVRQAAQRVGCALDAFAPVQQEADRLAANLDAREAGR